MFAKTDKIEPKISNSKTILINLNNNLIKTCFSFCSIEDIINLSLVCKKFYEITKELDYNFKEICELNFCYNYNNL